jgi:hypothetical protein
MFAWKFKIKKILATDFTDEHRLTPPLAGGGRRGKCCSKWHGVMGSRLRGNDRRQKICVHLCNLWQKAFRRSSRHHRIGQRKRMRLHLTRQRVGRCSQRMHAQRCNIRATLFNQRRIAIAHRMRHHHERQCQVTDAFCGHLSQRRECGAYHGDGRHAQRFEFGRVTRGPWG